MPSKLASPRVRGQSCKYGASTHLLIGMFFRLRSIHDTRSGGSVLAKFIRRIEVCAQEKAARKAKYLVACSGRNINLREARIVLIFTMVSHLLRY